MAKKTKGDRIQVILQCTEQKESGVPGMSRYITTKNRKNTTERLELKKYNPYLKKYTIHKEIKEYLLILAKKTVATLQTGEGRNFSKVIKMVRSPKTGAYVFEERMVPNDKVEAYLK